MCRYSRLWLVLLAEVLISRVWNNDSRFFWIDGCERKVLVGVSTSCRQVALSKLDHTYGRVTKGTLGDSLEQRRFTNVRKTNLNTSLAKIEVKHLEENHTIPLFKLFPGRPKRIFFSSTAFFGGIFFFFA